MSDVDVINEARTNLRTALSLDWPAFQVSPEVEDWLLGQAWMESRFGSTPDWGKSNNWGAVTESRPGMPFIAHCDRTADGTPTSYHFRAYPDQLSACRDWLHVLLRHGVPAALAGPVRGVCAEMYRNGYFTGISGSADDRIDAYVQFSSAGQSYVEACLAVADGLPNVATTVGLQAALNRLGFPVDVDGKLGPQTETAVRAFQADRGGLVIDGVSGPATQRALLQALRAAV